MLLQILNPYGIFAGDACFIFFSSYYLSIVIRFKQNSWCWWVKFTYISKEDGFLRHSMNFLGPEDSFPENLDAKEYCETDDLSL